MELIAGVDQGTQSTRCFLFDAKTKLIASHQLPVQQIYPHPGWCEHNPEAILSGVLECIREALKAAEAKVGPCSVKAIGVTNQRETLVAWDRQSGKSLHNAIVWHDNRTSDICKRLEAQLGSRDFFRPVTGLPISTYFSAIKYQWLHENVPAVRAAMEQDRCQIGTIDSWLIYQLTGGVQGGVHVTDVTNASRTLLMDLASRQWHGPFLETFRIRARALPRIVSNSEVYGVVAAGLPAAGVPIAGCLGDQMAAMLGQRCTRGMAKNTYGTGCFMLLHTGPDRVASSHGLLTTMAFQLGPHAQPQYALEGSVAVAGQGVSWLRDNLGIISGPDEVEALAASVPDCGGVYFVPAFSGLLAPRWQDSARGSILGLSGFTTKAHIARAMLEAICWQSREVLDAMRRDADLHGLALLRVDGGATKNNLLMQLQADILQVPVVRPRFQETTVLGAALAAGLAIGMWGEADVFEAHTGEARTRFEPSVSREAAEKRYLHWQKAVGRCVDLADMAT